MKLRQASISEGPCSLKFRNNEGIAMSYKPMMSQKEARIRRAWQDASYRPLKDMDDVVASCFGRKFIVPRQVHPPQPITLLQESVLKEVRKSDKILDMGTGSGINAILAASKSSKITAVDVNPYAVKCARNNARLNRVSSRIQCFQSDLFQQIQGRFDLIIFDPPFRWFRPRDIRERATADENFETMTAFFKKAKNYLSENGRILTCYGTTGDMNYFQHVLKENNFKVKTLNKKQLTRNNRKWFYYSYKLTLP
jgi:release factor glutamine methyltransferase